MDKNANLSAANIDQTEGRIDDPSMTNDSVPVALPASERLYPFLAAAHSPEELGRLGDYRVLQLLGEGGMGFVFKGEDLCLKRDVALKVMRPEVAKKPQAAERFLREGRAAAGLKSDHIITIYQVGQANGVPFLALEFLQGLPLDQWMKRQAPPIKLPAVLRIVRDTLRGLAVAHDKGLIHRDIKPANLWLEQGTSRVKVLDFGLTRSQDSNDQVTADGAVVGTPAYMAPEQASGKAVDPRADLFSVGTVMYQLLAGRNPFVQENVMGTLGAVCFELPPPIGTLRPDVPAEYAAFLDRLLAKDPNARPANAKDALAELAAIEKKLHDASRTAVTSSVPAPIVAPLAAPAEPAEPVWDNIDATDTHVDELPIAPRPKLATKKPPQNKTILLGGLAAFVVLVVVGVVLIIANKGGSKANTDGSDVAKGDGQGSTKPSGKNEPKKDTPKLAKTPDRLAAEYVLSIGGAVGVNGAGPEGRHRLHELTTLPKSDFELTHVTMTGPQVTDQGMTAFQGTKHIVHVHFQGCPNLTSKGLMQLQDNRAMDYVEVLDCDKIDDQALTVCKEWKNLTVMNVARCAQITDAGLAHLQGCKRLVCIGLNGCPRVTDAGLGHIKDCTEMTNIQLSKTNITDAGLAYFKDCKKIIIVHLVECPKITNAGFAQLANYPQLAHVELSDTKITDNDLVALKECKELTQVTLRNTNATAKGLAHLQGCAKLYLLDLRSTAVGNEALVDVVNWKELRHLDLHGTKVTDDGMPALAKATFLIHLNLQNTAITDTGLAHLQQLKNLTGLDLNGSKVTAKGVADFHKHVPTCRIHYDGGVVEPQAVDDPDRKAAEYALSLGAVVRVNGQKDNATIRKATDLPTEPFKLTYCVLDQKAVTKEGLQAFRQCAHLEGIGLSLCDQIDDDDLAVFQRCKEIRYLHLSRCAKITDKALALFQDCNQLEVIYLDGCTKVTNAGLAHLAKLPNLKQLRLRETQINDAGLQLLHDTTTLTSIDVSGTTITSAGLDHLKKNRQLSSLLLSNTSLTDTALLLLKNWPNLRVLYLNDTRLTGANLDDLKQCPQLETLILNDLPLTEPQLAPLAERSSLKHLSLLNTKLTPESIKKLHTKIPQCLILADGLRLEPKTSKP